MIFAVLIVITAVLQQKTGGFLRLGDARAFLLVPLTVCIAMHEKSLAALFFGVFAGLLWDGASVTVDGFFTLLLAVTGFWCSVFITFKMRKNLLSCLLLSFASLLVCVTLYYISFFMARGYGQELSVYFRHYFSSAVYSALYTPLIYYLVSGITSATEPEKKRINY